MKHTVVIRGKFFKSKLSFPTIKDSKIYLMNIQHFSLLLDYGNFVSIRIIKL